MNWSYMQMVGLHPKSERINLNKISSTNLKFYLPQAKKKNITLENNIPNYLEVLADKEHLNSILRNLISNAIKFSFKNTKITVGGKHDGNYSTIYVKDEGKGITKNKIDDIFKAGVSEFGTSGEKDTGLGLALCQEFVEKNSGKIWVESEKGKGSTFYISLPNS